MKKKLDIKYPPVYGTLDIEQFEKNVDHNSFPKCDSCKQPIYHPAFYEGDDVSGMCGPCTLGEADTIMWHEDEIDGRYAKKEFVENYI